jgi:hypothetical protein
MSAIQYEARRFCKGDNSWTNWQACTEAQFKEYATDSSFEVRTVSEYRSRIVPAEEGK